MKLLNFNYRDGRREEEERHQDEKKSREVTKHKGNKGIAGGRQRDRKEMRGRDIEREG